MAESQNNDEAVNIDGLLNGSEDLLTNNKMIPLTRNGEDETDKLLSQMLRKSIEKIDPWDDDGIPLFEYRMQGGEKLKFLLQNHNDDQGFYVARDKITASKEKVTELIKLSYDDPNKDKEYKIIGEFRADLRAIYYLDCKKCVLGFVY